MLFSTLTFALLLSTCALSNGQLVCPRGRDHECSSVSTHNNYVACVNHVCQCKTSQGFVGAATPTSMCSCPSGKSIYHLHSEDDTSLPYCVDLADAVSWEQEQTRNDLLTGTISSLYNSLVFPTPQIIMGQLITGQTVGGIWDLVATNAVGRVDPLGEFSTKDGIVEYFYGQVWTGGSQIQQVVINKLLVEGNEVTISVDLHFYIYDTWPGGQLLTDYNLTQSGVFTFNDQNQIQSMDLVIHNLGKAVNWFFADHAGEITRLCEIILDDAFCSSSLDPTGYYANMDDCVSFMNTVDYGTWDDIRENSVACRQFHAILAIARPQVHCPHAGKTGGGKCVPSVYTNYYLTQF